MLHISELNVYYGESHILRNVDLNIYAGEMVCLIGRNGVGKTTLLKTLLGKTFRPFVNQKVLDLGVIGGKFRHFFPEN